MGSAVVSKIMACIKNGKLARERPVREGIVGWLGGLAETGGFGREERARRQICSDDIGEVRPGIGDAENFAVSARVLVVGAPAPMMAGQVKFNW